MQPVAGQKPLFLAEAEKGVEQNVGFSDEEVRGRHGEAADPVDRVGQPVIALQRPGEQLQQPPGQQDADDVAGHQYRGSLE